MADLHDLAYRAGLDAGTIEPHRPFIDQTVLTCQACGGPMRRVSQVVDTAFETAVVALNLGHPEDRIRHAHGHPPRTVLVDSRSEHQGWLQDLAKVADLLPENPPWDDARVLPAPGIELDQESGQSPPADTVRWAALAGTTPQAAERDILRPLWRTAAERLPAQDGSSVPERSQLGTGSVLLDQWLLARLEQTTRTVTDALDHHDWERAAKHLAELVSDYTGWYQIHRKDGGVEIMDTLLTLLAPFVPHLTEGIHLRSGTGAVASIHLARWPSAPLPGREPPILAQVGLIRDLESQGLRARREAGIEADRLLPLALVGPSYSGATPSQDLALLMDLLKEALIVSRLRFTADVTAKAAWELILDRQKAMVRELAVDEIEACLRKLKPGEAAELADQLLSGRSVSLATLDSVVTLLRDEVLVKLRAKPGWTCAAGGGYCVLLKLG